MKKMKTFVVWLILAVILIVGLSAAAIPQYRARLLGANEVPPVDTRASGFVQIKHSSDGSELVYRIIVNNSPTIVASHIHCAPAGVNGPVGVTLYAAGPVDVDGVLVSSAFSAPNEGNACGWVTLNDVVNAIVSGNAYVNVHTTAHPSGEIRGQLQVSP